MTLIYVFVSRFNQSTFLCGVRLRWKVSVRSGVRPTTSELVSRCSTIWSFMTSVLRHQLFSTDNYLISFFSLAIFKYRYHMDSKRILTRICKFGRYLYVRLVLAIGHLQFVTGRPTNRNRQGKIPVTEISGTPSDNMEKSLNLFFIAWFLVFGKNDQQ